MWFMVLLSATMETVLYEYSGGFLKQSSFLYGAALFLLNVNWERIQENNELLIKLQIK